MGEYYSPVKINIMGKGDKKTRRGKIISGSFGVRRPKHKASSNSVTQKKEIVLKSDAAEKKAKIAAMAKTDSLVKIESSTKALVKKTVGVETNVVKTAPAAKVETKKVSDSKTVDKPAASKTTGKKKVAATKETKKPKEEE